LLTEAGIDINDVYDEARTTFKWAQEYFDKYSKWPTVKQVEENTNITLTQVEEDLEYICDIVRKRKLGKALSSDYKKGIAKLENRDPDGSLADLKEAVARHTSHKDKGEVRSFRKLGLERHDDYRKLQADPSLIGIPTPWEALNSSIGGWVNGQLHVLLAQTNVGKSWGCCLFAQHAMQLGYKVLLVTMEMSTTRFERMLDALQYRIPFGDLRQTAVDMITDDRWRDELRRETMGTGDILTTDKLLVSYVSDVNNLIQEYQPDLVIVDGGYRFAGKTGTGDWELSKNIVAGVSLDIA